MRKTILTFVVAILVSCSLFAQDKNNWILFRGDANLSGVSNAALP